MNVALVISSLSSGGAERVMSQLASYWAARGDAVTLITIDGAKSDAYALHPAVKRVALDMMRDSGGIFQALAANARRMAAVRRAVRASGAAALLSFEDRTNVMVLLATLALPVRRVISQRIDPLRHRIGTAWTIARRAIYPLADVLVVQTAALRPWARRLMLGARRTRVIPNPVRDMSAHARAANADGLRIVAIGRLVAQKGYDVLLPAFARIAAEFPAATLTIAGEGAELGALTAQARALGIGERVAFPGWVDEPGALLAGAAVFAMPSRYEGFPNALLEAMACGVASVSTRWMGAEEIVTDGVDALVVDVDDETALAGALRRLLGDADLRSRIGAGARAVSERYKLASVIEQWDAALAGDGRVMEPVCSRKFSS